ncbi:MAG: type II toxin-antitoxin system VapC family toxin [Dongiaceae bacterium]
MILVDTNVLLDLATNDAIWAAWSQAQLEAAALRDDLAINAVIYAELSIGFRRIEEVDAMLETTGLRLEPIPRPALFLAGKAFHRYRAAGGARTGVLPDFFIGAHAAVAGAPLLTRDAQRYRTYFPTVEVVGPEG